MHASWCMTIPISMSAIEPLGAPFNVHLNKWMQHAMTVVCQLIILYISCFVELLLLDKFKVSRDTFSTQ